MKKIYYLFAMLAMGLCVTNGALANVKAEMMTMNRYVNAVARAQTAEELQQAAQSLREAAIQAQAKKPSSVNSENLQGYQQGMQHFIDTVGQIEQLAKQGKLDEARELSKKLQDLKKEYHSKYK